MKTSRREAIKAGLAAGAAVVVDPGWLAARCEAAPPGSALQPETLAADTAEEWPTRGALEARTGDVFHISRNGSPIVDLRLARVGDVPCAPAAGLVGHAGCFVAVFAGPAGASIAQDTYRVENRTMAAFELFVVPGGRSDEGTTFVATFNRRSHTI